MAPIIATLLQNGLNLLGNAVLAKGKAVVEDKLGIELSPNLSAEQVTQLKQLEFQHEQWLVTADKEYRQQELEASQKEDEQTTKRWELDMASDSYLSKNTRPLVLWFLLAAYTVLSLLSAFGYDVNQAYVELLGQWGMLVMTAYFGGRTLEKLSHIKRKDNK